ncbi:hypothetical protein AB0I52_26575 [Streptomyces sp. NPDC050423]|uniref:hypothetical protein n=1 Tax=Streptomyces sp. NPDC050423 TaxID=3155402 RepID=UPI00342AB7F6
MRGAEGDRTAATTMRTGSGRRRPRAKALFTAAAALGMLLVGAGAGTAPASPAPQSAGLARAAPAGPSQPPPTQPVTTEFGAPLTVQTIRGRKCYIDAWGIPHVYVDHGDSTRAEQALAFLNRSLAKSGLAYDDKTKTGYEYVFQDDQDREVDKTFADRNFTGSTADMLKLTWSNGRLLSIDSVDSTGTGDSNKNVSLIDNEVRSKLPGGKKNQTENVVYTAANRAQAQKLANHYKDNPHVRVIEPSSGFDSGEFTAGTEAMKAAAGSVFAPPPSGCPEADKSLDRSALQGSSGSGTARFAGFTRRAPCPDAEEEGKQATAPGGLQKEMRSPAQAPGGIDFSQLELHYLADPGKSGLRYAFQAPLAAKGNRSALTGLSQAQESSDAFFTWLELDPSSFWVNLNPNEPDRIVDAKLGTTDAGRVLLQADLQLKKTTGKLIHPDSALGARFWKSMSGDCMAFRTWIVPGTATVYAKGDELYILKSPLNVQMETEYLKQHGGSGATSCPQQSASVRAHNESLFRSQILPKVVAAVNSAPEYANLRRVYLSRVAAEWYRQLSEKQDTTYGSLIDQGDVGPYRTQQDWRPIDTFHAYVNSYTKGEFKVTHRTRQGNTIYTRTYIYGGVDFTRVAFTSPTPDEVATMPALTANVSRSLTSPVTDTGAKRVWLGGGEPAATSANGSDGDPGASGKHGKTGRTGTDTAAEGGTGTPVRRWALLGAALVVALLVLRGVVRGRRRAGRR